VVAQSAFFLPVYVRQRTEYFSGSEIIDATSCYRMTKEAAMSEETMGEFNRTKGKMVDDFKAIVTDADDLLQATAKVSGEGFNAARAKFAERLKSAKTSLAEAEQQVVDKAKQAATATDNYVKGNPWTAVGIAAGVGILVGFLVAKR
jgi:ElaB/YqjD/DUF883 family membrane-anchored ribosome-binding protein